MSHAKDFLSKSAVVVFGGAGYIGRGLIEYLLKSNISITVICVDPVRQWVPFPTGSRVYSVCRGYSEANKKCDEENIVDLLKLVNDKYETVYIVNVVNYHRYRLGRPSKCSVETWKSFTRVLARATAAVGKLQCGLMLSGSGCSLNLMGLRSELESEWLSCGTRASPMVVIRVPYVYGPRCPLLNTFCHQKMGFCPPPERFSEKPHKMIFLENLCSIMVDALLRAKHNGWASANFEASDCTPTMTLSDLAHEVCMVVDKTARTATPKCRFYPMETMFGDVVCEERLRWIGWAAPTGTTSESRLQLSPPDYPDWTPPHSWPESVELMGAINQNARKSLHMSFLDILMMFQPDTVEPEEHVRLPLLCQLLSE
ncbi:protein ORF28 [Cyprinid herpesvirus 1]|uniref:Protein ORF28 n=1 Tax=Cyprinid herpesvirus 1 TaxID=317858 RepID=K7PC53_9VIRU|nr:protein ORF28 [Cyprinid herpesvirus 1]AFJ20332.1 protein ORF28 [Cyprinid herpesvirus 1]